MKAVCRLLLLYNTTVVAAGGATAQGIYKEQVARTCCAQGINSTIMMVHTHLFGAKNILQYVCM